jgi:flagellin
MASVLNTNMASISAQRYLTTAQNKLQTSYERLSSGTRINRAQDDAAGMGVSQRLVANINSTSMAIRNANDAIGVVQTSEGALAEISTMLQRFKELAVQGANAALSNSQRGFLHTEMNGLKSEITAIANRTTFNGNGLLSNSTSLSFQTGAATSDTITVNRLDLMGSTNALSDMLGAAGFGAMTAPDPADSTVGPTVAEFQTLNGTGANTIDAAIDYVATQRASFGSQVNRLNHNIANLTALHENLSAANSRVVDTDYANETATLTKTQILQQAATAMLSQANAQPNVVLALLK